MTPCCVWGIKVYAVLAKKGTLWLLIWLSADMAALLQVAGEVSSHLHCKVCSHPWRIQDPNNAGSNSSMHPHLTSLILMTAECPILCTATTLSPRWQYLSCFATDMAACTCRSTHFIPDCFRGKLSQAYSG